MMSPVMTEFQSRFRQDRSVGGQDVQEFLLFILESVDEELVHIKRGFRDQSNLHPLLNDQAANVFYRLPECFIT